MCVIIFNNLKNTLNNSSCYHLHYGIYKQLFPHRTVFFFCLKVNNTSETIMHIIYVAYNNATIRNNALFPLITRTLFIIV